MATGARNTGNEFGAVEKMMSLFDRAMESGTVQGRSFTRALEEMHVGMNQLSQSSRDAIAANKINANVVTDVIAAMSKAPPAIDTTVEALHRLKNSVTEMFDAIG